MKLNQARLLLTLAILSPSVLAATHTLEHTDASVFDKQVIQFAPPVDTRSGKKDGETSNYISMLKKQGHSAVFEAKLTELTLAKVKMADGNIYNRIMLPDGAAPNEPGKPNLTGYRQLVRIPDGAELELVVENVEWSKTYTDMVVDPVQLPFPDVVEEDGNRPDQHMPFVKDDAAYNALTDSEVPLISVVETVRVRGKSYAVISYRPIDFNSIEGTVRFAQKVRFKVNYILPDASEPKREDKLEFDAKKKAVIDLRDEQVEPKQKMDNVPSQGNKADLTPAQKADYLIITADRFQQTVEPLAAWKRKKGYQVHVATVTEVGSTQAQIKAYIKDAYSNGTMTSYVLLVGDHEDIPGYEIVGHPYHGKDHRWHTDYEYTLVDGDDKYSDVVIGRLPGDTEAQITTMVNRSLNYEQNPTDSDRYKHVLLAGQYQDRDTNRVADRMFMEDLHRAADFLGPDYDFFSGLGDRFNKGYSVHTALQWDADLTKELKYGGWNYGSARVNPPSSVPQVWKDQGNGDRVQIADAINQGVGFVMHRDHGYGNGSGWADPHYTATEVNALTNGNMAPFVFSLNCATGWFDGKDSFAESWMRNANGGAVGFTGAVRVSYSGYNDLMHAAILDSLWDDYDGAWSSAVYPVSWRPAMALNRAKDRLFGHYGAEDSHAILTARFFSWFGDPELELRTERPNELTVTYPSQLAKGSQAKFDVVVREGERRLAKARVALVSASGEAHVVTTDQNGVAQFDVPVEGNMSLTVTEHNAKAYQGQIQVEGDAPQARVIENITAQAHQWVALDGTKSVVPEGNQVTYLWQQVAGPKVRIDYADSRYAYAITPNYSSVLKFKLTITDQTGASDSAIQTITVKGVEDSNKAPIAVVKDAMSGTNQWTALDGTQSSDPDGKIVSYHWSQVSGPKTEIAYPDSKYAYTFTPNAENTLAFKLTVTDNEGKTSSSVAKVMVKS
ncbi:C25 family cysteine peptidase [Photobacterium frigidiphilum]|uniref:C25 family cysteine peptidase n=1 Tax=Photobacterium frigidiphilum TaxID=264736 RepID=UPI003D0C94CE